jgi:hypothetical protein
LRITGLANPLQAALLAALPKVAKFAVTEPVVQPAPPATPVGQPVSVEMLVTLAQSESPIDRRRRVATRADESLRALERLSHALPGVPVVEQLKEIAATMAQLDTPQDPALAGLIKDIELRMRVELAKHDIVA